MPLTKEELALRERERYHLKRNYALNKLGNKCALCGSARKLQLDHKDPARKSFNISRSMSWERFLKELEKCQLLCQACHSEKHQGPKRKDHGTWGMYRNRKCRCEICTEFFRDYRREWRRRKRAMGIKPS